MISDTVSASILDVERKYLRESALRQAGSLLSTFYLPYLKPIYGDDNIKTSGLLTKNG